MSPLLLISGSSPHEAMTQNMITHFRKTSNSWNVGHQSQLLVLHPQFPSATPRVGVAMPLTRLDLHLGKEEVGRGRVSHGRLGFFLSAVQTGMSGRKSRTFTDTTLRRFGIGPKDARYVTRNARSCITLFLLHPAQSLLVTSPSKPHIWIH